MTPTRRKATVFPYRGKWRVQYLDLFGNQRTLTADTRQAAYLKLAQIEGEVRGGFLNPKADAMPSFGRGSRDLAVWPLRSRSPLA
jgi:integrase